MGLGNDSAVSGCSCLGRLCRVAFRLELECDGKAVLVLPPGRGHTRRDTEATSIFYGYYQTSIALTGLILNAGIAPVVQDEHPLRPGVQGISPTPPRIEPARKGMPRIMPVVPMRPDARLFLGPQTEFLHLDDWIRIQPVSQFLCQDA